MNKAYWFFIKPFLPPIIFSFLFLAFVLIVKPHITVISGIVTLFTIFAAYRANTELLVMFRNIAVNNFFLFSIYFLYTFLGGYGFFGLLLAVLIVVAVILFRRRKLFLNTIRDVEVLLFGHTNDRRKKK